MLIWGPEGRSALHHPSPSSPRGWPNAPAPLHSSWPPPPPPAARPSAVPGFRLDRPGRCPRLAALPRPAAAAAPPPDPPPSAAAPAAEAAAAAAGPGPPAAAAAAAAVTAAAAAAAAADPPPSAAASHLPASSRRSSRHCGVSNGKVAVIVHPNQAEEDLVQPGCAALRIAHEHDVLRPHRRRLEAHARTGGDLGQFGAAGMRAGGPGSAAPRMCVCVCLWVCLYVGRGIGFGGGGAPGSTRARGCGGTAGRRPT